MTECQSHTLLRRTTPKNENPRSVVFDFISPVSFNKSLDAPQDDVVAVWKATGSPVRILNEFQIILGKVNRASVSKRLHFSGGRWLIFLEQSMIALTREIINSFTRRIFAGFAPALATLLAPKCSNAG